MPAPSTTDRLNVVIQAAQLLEINLKSSTVECHVPPQTIVATKTDLEYERSYSYIASDDSTILVCFASLGVKGFLSNSNPRATESIDQTGRQLLFEIKGTFSLVYRLEPKVEDRESLELFASKQAPYTAHSYFREFIQQMSLRLGIPPVKLPLIKPATRTEVDQTETKEVSKKTKK